MVRKKARLLYTPEDEETAARLEAALFGSAADVLKDVVHEQGDDPLAGVAFGADTPSDLLFVEDRGGSGSGSGGGSEFDAGSNDDDSSSYGGGGGGGGSASAGDRAADDSAAGPGPGSAAQGAARLSGRAPAWRDPSDADLSVGVAAQARLRKLRQSKAQTSLEGEAYAAALRKQHQAIHPRTGWAALPCAPGRRRRTGASGVASEALPELPSDDEGGGGVAPEEAAALLLRTAGGLLAPPAPGAGGPLPAGAIDAARARDANQHAPTSAVVRAARFHPRGQLLATAGFDKKLRLFSIDGLRNPLLQSVHFADLPIHDAAWAAGGAVAVVAGRRPFYCVYDVGAARVERLAAPPGPHAAPPKSLERFAVCSAEAAPLLAFLLDGGHVSIVSLRGRTAVGAVKMSGTARCAAFDDDGTHLLTAGSDGVVYTWDLRMRRVLHQLRDEGSVGATALALAPGGRWLAAGSSSGVVNLYRRPGPAQLEAWAGGDGAGGPVGPEAGTPARALMNLTTCVDTLAFSPDGQMLVMASRMKRDALRLVHVPSQTVFANWPTARTPLHYVHCAGFSPGGGFLTMGNAKGRALLYRLRHYPGA